VAIWRGGFGAILFHGLRLAVRVGQLLIAIANRLRTAVPVVPGGGRGRSLTEGDKLQSFAV
jgi:hypothetical protein